MLRKPGGCSLCPLYKKGRGFVPDTIPNGAKYVFIGEAPGNTEVEEGEAFVGQAGFVLWEWGVGVVPELKLARERGLVGKGNVLRCLPPKQGNRAYPQGEERRLAETCCRQYDKWPDDATFILCGEFPQRLFFGPELHKEDLLDRKAGRNLKGVFGRVGRWRCL